MVEDRAGVKRWVFQSRLGTQIIYKSQGFVCGLATELKHAWKSQARVRIMGPWGTILMCNGTLRDGQDRPLLAFGPSRRASTGVIWPLVENSSVLPFGAGHLQLLCPGPGVRTE